MRPSIVVSLLIFFFFSYVVVSEAKLQQQATIDANDDEDDDERDDDDDDIDNSRPEVDDDGRIYKNPRNSPSAMCPRDEKQAKVLDQTCLRRCSADEDCKSKKKKCRCDGPCGMSCIKPEKECAKLSEIDHGKMTVTGNHFGDNAHYLCEDNYYIIGLSERTCRADGRWTGSTPSCTKDRNSFCVEPPKISNAKHYAPVEQKGFELNTTIQYFCDYGYQATGFQSATCFLINGKASWFGPDITCDPVNCGLPADIAYGWHGGDCYTFNCTVTYHCVDGYKLIGKAEKVCAADGTWSPREPPQCMLGTPAQCPLPENPRNGKAVYTSHAYNAIVSYECRHGYVLRGNNTRVCQADRKWSGQAPVCEEINCGLPGILYNGWIENIESGTGLGASIIFRCKEHMKLAGNTSSVCENDGKWRYPLPQCLAPCIIPEIEKGSISIASHEVNHINNVTVVEHGERLNVHCIDNYEFAANNTPVMCNNGTWTIIPTCSPARCKQMPRAPKNGMVIAPKMNHGMRAIFKCKDGFTLVGGGPDNSSMYVECNYGTWIGEIPHCEEVYCAFPGYVKNGKVLLVGNMGVYDYRPYVKKVPNNKQIMYDCDKGYVLDEGPTGATCIGGKWSPKELPTCLRGQHPRLRWSRRRRSVDTIQSSANATTNFKKFIEFFRRVGKKLLHLELEKAQANELSDSELKDVTLNYENSTEVFDGKEKLLRKVNRGRKSEERNREKNIDRTIDNLILKKKHPYHKNKSRSKDEKMIEFLKTVYRKLKRIDSKRMNNGTNTTMHDILNLMSKNFFHVDLSETRKNNSSRNHDSFEVRNQREFMKLKREFERIMRFYNKSLRWSEKQNRKESKKRKTKVHDNEKKNESKYRKHNKEDKLKNYYKGFYEFIDGYVNERLSILESQNATDDFIDKIDLDKMSGNNESTFTIGEVYAFFKHIIENKLNNDDSTSTPSTTIPETTSSMKTSTVLNNEKHNQTSTTPVTTIIPNNFTTQIELVNEIPLVDNKTEIAKHRTKRIRNVAELKANVTHQNRKLLSVSSQLSHSQKPRVKRGQSNGIQNLESKEYTSGEYTAQLSDQERQSRRFISSTEINNQIMLKNLYLNAYEDEYRANTNRSILDDTYNTDDNNDNRANQTVSRRRKGNLSFYDNE
ncbi:uncharacterized protein Hasp [Chelonus insularis]|uniref:uncharacterized protein Hasp n=1 Tax=Chelonus insularis TaxID=460826 RepID=UPI00158CEEDB|nr:uncharacterized protein LOC118074049 [Chelonus insularis]